MENIQNKSIGGSLQISTDVIGKIARIAAIEVDGVKETSTCTQGAKGLLKKPSEKKDILVILYDDVAEITVNLVVEFGKKVQPLCLKVQENVKHAVQNMTGITVSRVNVVIAGVSREQQEQ